jgi:selenocysteine-specific elongation factor
VRGLQVHGRDVDEALAGERTAVALSGDAIDLEHVRRGQTLVTVPDWPASRMLTVRFTLLPDSTWELAHNQRLRVHLGTAEVMARCVLFDDAPLGAGATGWGQLRLEVPAAARARQRLVIRSYSPVVTIGGAEVAEPFPPKRRRADAALRAGLVETLEGDAVAAVGGVARRAGWAGTGRGLLPVSTGLAPGEVAQAVAALEAGGAQRTSQGRLVAAELVERARDALVARVAAVHEDEPFRPGLPVEVLRGVLPARAAPGLADDLLAALVDEGRLTLERGVVARAGFEPTLTPAQRALETSLAECYRGAGLAPPRVDDLPAALRGDPTFWTLLRRLETSGRLVPLEDGLFIWADALAEAARAVDDQLAGRSGLGPADFKDAVAVSRRHLLPILAHFDRTGVTVRDAEGRAVPGAPGNTSGA